MAATAPSRRPSASTRSPTSRSSRTSSRSAAIRARRSTRSSTATGSASSASTCPRRRARKRRPRERRRGDERCRRSRQPRLPTRPRGFAGSFRGARLLEIELDPRRERELWIASRDERFEERSKGWRDLDLSLLAVDDESDRPVASDEPPIEPDDGSFELFRRDDDPLAILDAGIDRPAFRLAGRLEPKVMAHLRARHVPGEIAWDGVPHVRNHVADLVAIGEAAVTEAGLVFEDDGVDLLVRLLGTDLRDEPVERPATLEPAVGEIALADHIGEGRVAKVSSGAFGLGRRSGGRVDGSEPVGHRHADRERAVTTVRIAEDVDAVRIDIAEDEELPDELRDDRVGVIGVEAVPLVGGRSQRDVAIA